MISGYMDGQLVHVPQWFDTVVPWAMNRAQLRVAYEQPDKDWRAIGVGGVTNALDEPKPSKKQIVTVKHV